mgnify:CR=1 FL=1
MTDPKWLAWAQHMHSIAQAGLTYCRDPFDRERYAQLNDLAAEILANYTAHPLNVLQDILTGERGYATPKVDTRGVVFQDSKILLVKERSDGGWTLPGGWVDLGETPSRAVEREIWEESGYETRAVKLLALYDRNLHGHPPFIFHTYKLYFLCELTGGAPAMSMETDGVDFFREDSLPPLSIMRTTESVLHRMFEHHRNPDLPTDYD